MEAEIKEDDECQELFLTRVIYRTNDDDFMRVDCKAVGEWLQLLSLQARYVMLGCTINLGYGNIIRDRQCDIAKLLGMHRSNVSAAFKELLKKKVIYLINGQYVLTPHYIWKGNPGERQKMVRKIDVINYGPQWSEDVKKDPFKHPG